MADRRVPRRSCIRPGLVRAGLWLPKGMNLSEGFSTGEHSWGSIAASVKTGAICVEQSLERWSLRQSLRRVLYPPEWPRRTPRLAMLVPVRSLPGLRQPGRGRMKVIRTLPRRPDQLRYGFRSSDPRMGSRRCGSCRNCSALDTSGARRCRAEKSARDQNGFSRATSNSDASRPGRLSMSVLRRSNEEPSRLPARAAPYFMRGST